ncbi:MAG: chloride channel protein [Planctomycetes bacterium]|nr:chloride channel protein [Planctomycetota bacterium]
MRIRSLFPPGPIDPRRMRTRASFVARRLNLIHVWRWVWLAGLVGCVAGLGALLFQWLTEQCIEVFWGRVIGYTPPGAGGEPFPYAAAAGPPSALFLILAPAVGGAISAFLVYRFAPEAQGHGTDAAIRAYHKNNGRIDPKVPIVKLFASAATLGSGGSAGREGPIAQIGAGFGSLLGRILNASDRDRRILMASGLGAGIGAIFRAPFAAALFASEVLYSEPDMEPDVVLPALLSTITSYCIYCSVHGFGHLFTGTEGFAFSHPLELLPYAALGVIVACAAILYVKVFYGVHGFFKKLNITNYVKPIIGAGLTGALGLAAWKIAGSTSVLAIMGSGYGTLQQAVRSSAGAGPTIIILLIVAFGKIVTTALTIGSGGSGGIFGPAMVIGGCLGAAVGAIAHDWMPTIVVDAGPFAIVGMAGFFAGAANAPISTVIMVADLTGNYGLLLPSMVVVSLSYLIAKRWTIYREQVPTRTDSDAHRNEIMIDVLDSLMITDILIPVRSIDAVSINASIAELRGAAAASRQSLIPVLSDGNKLSGHFETQRLKHLLANPEYSGAAALDAGIRRDIPCLSTRDTLQKAFIAFAEHDYNELPVLSNETTRELAGFITRKSVIASYLGRRTKH